MSEDNFDDFIDDGEETEEDKKIKGSMLMTFEVDKRFVGNDVFPKEMISIDGNFRTGGFASPYHPEEFSEAKLQEVIKWYKESEAKWWNIPIDKIIVKITKDFRVKQTNLFDF